MFSKSNITQDITSEQRYLIEFPPLPNKYSAVSRWSSNDAVCPDNKNMDMEEETYAGAFKKSNNSEIRPDIYRRAETDGDDKDMNNKSETFPNVDKKATEGKIPKPPDTSFDNHFGLIGLLSCIRTAESNPNLVTLAMGMDLDELGLNLTTTEPLYSNFSGPFSDRSSIYDIDCLVPPQYLVNDLIKNELGPINMAKLKDDTIFFLFYGCVGDFIQLVSAAELYKRSWRFHIEEKVWFTRVPGLIYYIHGTIKKGMFHFFDPRLWRRVAKEFEFDVNKLEINPALYFNQNPSSFFL